MKRIRVTWNKSESPKTNYYQLYRSTRMNIEEENLSDLLVARIEKPPGVNPVHIVDEPVIMDTNMEYKLEHKNILLSWNGVNYDFTLKRADGGTVGSFSLDIVDGAITFENENTPEMELLASYTYDGVDMWDYGVTEPRKTYYGPEAKDTSKPSVPENVQLVPEYDLNRIKLVWDESTPEGSLFYYRVKAFQDDNTYSRLSKYRSGRVTEDLADRPYVIEKSIDSGVTWKDTARVKQREYIDFLLDNNPPLPVRNLTSAMSKRTEDTNINVTLTWTPLSVAIPKDSPMYRVRAINAIGYASEPSSPVGPIPFDTPIKELVIRVKEKDGTMPTFDGPDAGTSGTVSKDATSYDLVVRGNAEYAIAIYVVDLGGNISVPTVIDIMTPDNSKPVVPTILSVSEFSTIIN